MKKTLTAIALLAATTLAAANASADTPSSPIGVVSNINIVSDKSEDLSSLEAWKKAYIKDGMSDEDKAIAIWKSVVRYRHQDSPPFEYTHNGCVHDPIKTINVYGYGQCCCASNIEGLARYLSMPAQGRSITAHSVPEVWYDGAWHLFDASLMSYFRNASGKVASVDEINQSIKDWRKDNPGKLKDDTEAKAFSKNEGWKNGPPVLATVTTYNKDGINGAGWHGWWSNLTEYGKLPDKGVGYAPDGSGAKCVSVFDYGPSMGYQLNVQLRDGEKITRNWSNKGLHVNMHDKVVKNDKKEDIVVVNYSLQNKGPDIVRDGSKHLKTQQEFGDAAPGRVGNGVHEWNVPLASANLKLAAIAYENLQNKAEGATAAALTVKDAAQPGSLVIRMPSSYVYLTGEVSLNAVVGNGGSVAVLFSDNHGMDWKEIGKFDTSGEQKIDLKKQAFRKYDYQIKVVMNGAGTGLNALKLTHDIQHSQAALPVITEGDNKISFSAGAHEGTITYEGNVMDTKSDKNLSILAFHPVLNGLSEDKLQVGGTGKGAATFTIKTPGDITRLRINAHYRARDITGKDYWDVEASFDQGNTWKKIDRLDKGQPASSKYMVFTEVPAGSREAQVRFTGKQSNTVCMFDLRMDADYKEPTGGFKPVKITYVWDENGAEKKLEHIARTPTETFNIKCGPKTVAKSYTVELADK